MNDIAPLVHTGGADEKMEEEMYERWNKERLQRRYARVLKDAKERGFSDEDLERPYLTRLSHQTKSKRILDMVELAYYLGQLRAIRDIDEGYTPIVLD